MIGAYRPDQPGVSTYTDTLRAALCAESPDLTVDVLRTGDGAEPDDRAEVVHRVSGAAEAARTAAVVMNGYDAAIIHFARDAYGGDEGGQVLDVLQWVTVPVIVVMHDVHLEPNPQQRFIVEMLTSSADAVVALSETGRRVLLDDYRVEPRKLMVIRHGTAAAAQPAVPAARSTILTWGRLGPKTGIELGMAALALMNEVRPRYVVAGPLDPALSPADGAAYRLSLTRLASKLGVADRVEFAIGHLAGEPLRALVESADVILLPRDHEDRAASAVLAESIAARRPVVATAFPHALEMLGDGRAGRVVPHADPSAMAEAVSRILTEPELRDAMVAHNAATGLATTWPLIAGQYSQLIGAMLRRPAASRR
ncbi:glycosyltransferase [Catellatospora sichuanensis]|uniref:glycosyltransferase n=1 Tax=Catellatospora sichuanensis TaxID=1969805 RepID=UPI0011826FF4|nr:glycosyltransferase [Catellatospora sichuanensis]